MPKILISENIRGAAVDALEVDFDVLVAPDLWKDSVELASQLSAANALIVRNQTQVTGELISKANQLRVIGRAGAGLDNIDTEAASKQGIVVTYAPNENSISVAELAIGLMLSLARMIPAAVQDTRQGNWNRQAFVGGELLDKTLGIVGLGRIGRLTAARAKAFGMQLLAFDEFIDPPSAEILELGVELCSFEQLLASSDVVTIHVPLTDQTRGMMNSAAFNQMKASSVLVNTSRGEVVNETDLVEALTSKKIAGAALDVREVEPPGDSPLSSMDNVVLTPHIAAFTKEAQTRVVEAVCRDVAAVLSGNDAINAANFPRPR